jgi:hypothetical protein
MLEISMGDNEKIRKFPRKKGKKIVFCILGALFLAVTVLAIVNFSVLKLVFSPNNIAISEREESIAVLKQLESADSISGLQVSGDNNSVSFFSADESIKISSDYDGEQLNRISGEIDAGRVSVSTIEEARELARVVLSPYFNDDEIVAIFLRYSPSLIAMVRSDNINLSFNIGDSYHVTATGSAHTGIEFSIAVN